MKNDHDEVIALRERMKWVEDGVARAFLGLENLTKKSTGEFETMEKEINDLKIISAKQSDSLRLLLKVVYGAVAIILFTVGRVVLAVAFSGDAKTLIAAALGAER